MKKIFCLLLCLVALFTGNVVAQEKGDMYLGGSIGLDVSSVGDSGLSMSTVSFSFTPEYAYFVTNNFRIGAGLSLSVADEVTVFTIEPAFAYYVRLVDKLYYIPELKIGGGVMSSDGYSTGVFSLGVNLFALEFKPSAKVGLSLSLVNLSCMVLPENELTAFNFNLISTPQFGFRYYF
ncbi:MAG: hypothetical protein IKM35_01605 [Bacteroidaceae bacterium]|nr:hypothetical protein [Bacteroidaceae bacterium]